MKRLDKNALSYWFPLIRNAGLPVPETRILEMSNIEQQVVLSGLYGEDSDPQEQKTYEKFERDLLRLCASIGFPCFLRTDHTSGKHDWENTCFIASDKDIRKHIFGIVEYSEMVDILGLPWDTWVVREYLPVRPFGVCPTYGNMPVCREFRFFVEDENVICFHPYWPGFALDEGGASPDLDYHSLSTCSKDEKEELFQLASAAGKAVGGSWSVDILDTERGWFVTDMAEAKRSFHWAECPNREREWK